MLGRQLKSKDLKIKEKELAEKGNLSNSAIEHFVLQASRWIQKAIWEKRGVLLECLDTGLPVNGNPEIIRWLIKTKGSAHTPLTPTNICTHSQKFNQRFATFSRSEEQERDWCELKGVLPNNFRTCWQTPMIRTGLQKTAMYTRLSCYSNGKCSTKPPERWASSFWSCSSEKNPY